ncbi:MAG: dodecin family protein [Acidobacteriota bacterium]|jgi:flavin-binding protein dodecin
MSHVAKVIEIVGSSDKGWEDAAHEAIKVASNTVTGITGIEVEHMTATVTDGKITNYKTTVKIAFAVEH